MLAWMLVDPGIIYAESFEGPGAEKTVLTVQVYYSGSVSSPLPSKTTKQDESRISSLLIDRPVGGRSSVTAINRANLVN